MSIHAENVRAERTGFRDAGLQTRIEQWGDSFVANDVSSQSLPDSISRRHRDWGWDCPATNLDCLMYEYNDHQPVVLLDYKCKLPNVRDRVISSTKAIRNLAIKANIPFFVVYYNNIAWSFQLDPIGAQAESTMRSVFEPLQTISELQFVSFLYGLRKQPLPATIRDHLNADLTTNDKLNDLITF